MSAPSTDSAGGPELRVDPLWGHWVIVAEQRAGRPHDFVAAPMRASTLPCPFCPGQEHATPAPVLSLPEAQPWQVRVVPNKYPALVDAAWQAPSSARGVHEVIVESPRHVATWGELTCAELRTVLDAYHRRLEMLRASARWRYAIVFKNVGAAGGASLEHVHSQLMAMETSPPEVQRRLDTLLTSYEQHGRCALCERVELEIAGPRVVHVTPQFASFCPFASRTAGELWTVPLRHVAHFEALDSAALDELAEHLHVVASRLECILPQRAYNVVLQTTPWGASHADRGHLWWEWIPRVTQQAGFEWGSGCFINPLAPERAASMLRAKV